MASSIQPPAAGQTTEARAQADLALAFYREVGAARFVGRLEALLTA